MKGLGLLKHGVCMAALPSCLPSGKTSIPSSLVIGHRTALSCFLTFPDHCDGESVLSYGLDPSVALREPQAIKGNVKKGGTSFGAQPASGGRKQPETGAGRNQMAQTPLPTRAKSEKDVRGGTLDPRNCKSLAAFFARKFAALSPATSLGCRVTRDTCQDPALTVFQAAFPQMPLICLESVACIKLRLHLIRFRFCIPLALLGAQSRYQSLPLTGIPTPIASEAIVAKP
jgi:hypothetical protein